MPTKAELEVQLEDTDKGIEEALEALTDPDLDDAERADEALAILASVYDEEEEEA